MSKTTIATLLAAIAAGLTGAAGASPEPYHTILLQVSVIVAAFGGVFGVHPSPPGPPKAVAQ